MNKKGKTPRKDDPTSKNMTGITVRRRKTVMEPQTQVLLPEETFDGQIPTNREEVSDSSAKSDKDFRASDSANGFGLEAGGSQFAEVKSRRKSLPVSTKGLQMKFRQLRRASEKLKFLPEESEKTPPQVDEHERNVNPPTTFVKLEVKDGVVHVLDESEAALLSSLVNDEHVTHLVYGKAYTGVDNSEGIPDELVLVLTKVLDLQTLELRGFWNFGNLPTDFIDYLAYFPKLQHLNKLVLPRAGVFLDRMASILVGLFGLQLKSLVCSVEFLEGSCPEDVSKLVPGLRHLKIYDTTVEGMEILLKLTWNLDTLHLGQFKMTNPEICYGIPLKIFEDVAFQFGLDLMKFDYLFHVTDENGDLMDEREVELILKKYMPTAEIQVN